MKLGFEDRLFEVIDREKVKKDEPMKLHTTFRVGGAADYFVIPQTKEEIAEVIRVCQEHDMPYYIIGNGSNLLVGDKGFRGVIIQVFKAMNRLSVEGNHIQAQAGCSLAQIACAALEAGLGGFEFAAGIPGTIGGAVVMNAGAYGNEMKDVLVSVTVLTKAGEVKVLECKELQLGYRTSIIVQKEYVVLSAKIQLEPKTGDEIKGRMDELRKLRVSKQPLEYPSAGSTFKRPEGYFAGKLIQDAGLKGFTVGGAQVSEKHSGFVINADQATAADVQELMRQVIEKVKEHSQVELEPEVRQIGEF